MAPAGRTAPKHVATGPRETSTREGDRGSSGHHKAARRRRIARVAGPAVFALSAAGTVVALETGGDAVDGIEPAPAAVAPAAVSLRAAGLSRSLARRAVQPLPTAKRVTLKPAAVDHEFATSALNLRTGPGPDAPRVRTVALGARLAVTGQTADGWAEVLVEREEPVPGAGQRGKTRTVKVVRWVNAEYLAERKPEPPEPEPEATSTATSATTTTTGISGASCPDGSATESGLTSTAVQVYRAVCAAFPALSSYGGYAPRGEHYDGRAIDFMVTDPALGQAVADYLLANASALGLRNIIWAQQIWTPEQASAGWRYMEDRGSATANHYDHVHIAVY